MKNVYKSLQAIEYLVGEDLGMDLEWWLTDPKRKANKKLLEQAATVIGKIYMIAHSENSACKHEDWEQIKYEVIRAYNPLTPS